MRFERTAEGHIDQLAGCALTPAEQESSLRIAVTSTDGRSATVTTNAGDLEVEVIFGEKPKPRPTRAPTHAPPPTTTKHPWTKRR